MLSCVPPFPHGKFLPASAGYHPTSLQCLTHQPTPMVAWPSLLQSPTWHCPPAGAARNAVSIAKNMPSNPKARATCLRPLGPPEKPIMSPPFAFGGGVQEVFLICVLRYRRDCGRVNGAGTEAKDRPFMYGCTAFAPPRLRRPGANPRPPPRRPQYHLSRTGVVDTPSFGRGDVSDPGLLACPAPVPRIGGGGAETVSQRPSLSPCPAAESRLWSQAWLRLFATKSMTP